MAHYNLLGLLWALEASLDNALPCTPLGFATLPDLRRTFAKLAHTGRAPLEQIQLSLGHASVQTTERYLGLAQDLSAAPCDYLGLRVN